MSTGHTPPPWRLKDDPQYLIQAGGESEDPYTVANCWSGPFAPTKAVARENARLVVRAVNAHAALVDACEAALETLEHAELNRWEQEVADRLRAALALAKGETP
jgi:hypothetical protein